MNYITISTSDLKRLLELSAQFPFAVIDGADNTDGEGVWHCDVEYYDEQGDEDPTEVFSFNRTQDTYKMSYEEKYKIYAEMRDYFAGEDIKCIADEREVQIEQGDMENLVNEYNERADMTLAERDLIENLVDEYAKNRKEKQWKYQG